MSKDKKELILSINRDKNLSFEEKQSRIHDIMSGKFKPENKDDMSLNCPHFKTKKCSRMYFSCCKIYDCCHRCHMGKRNCYIKPPQVETIMCNECNFKQEPAESCVNCGVKFAPSFCRICKIWTVLECFHCDKCEVCRVGKPEDMWHCDNCEVCFSVKGRENHKCAASPLKNERCVICTESVHTAQKASNILPCGHVVHGECWREAAKRGAYRCPTCKKSLINMSRVWGIVRENVRNNRIHGSIPEIYENDVVDSPYGKFEVDERVIVNGVKIYNGTLLETGEMASFDRDALSKYLFVNITCNDCLNRSNVEFNFEGLECQNCGSFNTDRI